uniref:Uncharacterized protein n=1 Tax=viral metagenome TaxID=1070528 RepID=A0A6M3JNH9_9ZZZZ
MKRSTDKPIRQLDEHQLIMLALATILEGCCPESEALIAELYRRGCK